MQSASDLSFTLCVDTMQGEAELQVAASPALLKQSQATRPEQSEQRSRRMAEQVLDAFQRTRHPPLRTLQPPQLNDLDTSLPEQHTHTVRHTYTWRSPAAPSPVTSDGREVRRLALAALRARGAHGAADALAQLNSVVSPMTGCAAQQCCNQALTAPFAACTHDAESNIAILTCNCSVLADW